jgi:hypothetical protein
MYFASSSHIHAHTKVFVAWWRGALCPCVLYTERERERETEPFFIIPYAYS